MAEETVSLKEHFEKILAEKDKAFIAIQAAQHEATQILEANSQLWRASANEWRQAMDNKDKLLATKADLIPINNTLSELKTFKDQSQGKASTTSVYIGYAIALISIVFTLLNYLGK